MFNFFIRFYNGIQTISPSKIAPRLGLGLWLVLRDGGKFSSGTIVLEPLYNLSEVPFFPFFLTSYYEFSLFIN